MPKRDTRLSTFFEKTYQVSDPWRLFTSAYEQKKYDRQIAAISDHHPPQQILEIGCGEGAHTHRLAKRFPHSTITAVDISRTAIGRAEQARPKSLNVNFLCKDIRLLAPRIAPAQFDVIVWSESLGYICRVARLPELTSLLTSIANALAPSGLLCMANTLPASDEALDEPVANNDRLALRFCFGILDEILTCIFRARYCDTKVEDTMVYEYELWLFARQHGFSQ
jgi:SAM-dependent methyltransferase